MTYSPVPGVILETTTVNNIHLRYAEAGTGPLVMFCHGWPESWYSWRHQLLAVSEAGFRAVAPLRTPDRWAGPRHRPPAG